MFSDIHAMQSIYVAICILIALTLSQMADRNASDGLTRWALGLCLSACAYIIWNLKWFDPLTRIVPVPYVILSFSYVIFLLAVCQFLRRAVPRRQIIIWPMIILIGGLVCIHHPAHLTAFVSLVLFCQVCQLCLILAKARFHFVSVGRWITLTGGAIVLMIDLLRMTVALQIAKGLTDLPTMQFLTRLEFAMALFSVTLCSVGFTWMTRERACAERRTHNHSIVSARIFSDPPANMK